MGVIGGRRVGLQDGSYVTYRALTGEAAFRHAVLQLINCALSVEIALVSPKAITKH